MAGILRTCVEVILRQATQNDPGVGGHIVLICFWPNFYLVGGWGSTLLVLYISVIGL